MKLVRLLTLLLVIWPIGSISFAQSNKPDVIIKTDNTRIGCRIID
ncbi:hypothetical protein [Spirosoma telluris]